MNRLTVAALAVLILVGALVIAGYLAVVAATALTVLVEAL